MSEPKPSSIETKAFGKSPNMTALKNSRIPPVLTEPKRRGNLPALDEPKTPGNLPALTEPRTPENLPALTEPKTPGNHPALDEPKRPVKLSALAQISLFWLMGALTIMHPTMVTAPKFGRPASSEKFPYAAGLIDELAEVNYVPFCTGTVLTSMFVLTTYGCLKRPGMTARRRDKINPQSLLVIFGCGYSPPNALSTTLVRYQSRKASTFYFPTEEDLKDAYARDDNKDAIVMSHNEYRLQDKNGNTVTRYYLDFAVIKLESPLVWTDNIVPAVFPLSGRRLTRIWWEKKVFDYKSGAEFMEPCYMVGWGGWHENRNKQMRMRYTHVKYVPYENCELSLCNECAYCNKTWNVDFRHQTCYKSLLYADACAEDEGAPVWCPWAGITTTRNNEDYDTGAILGILSYDTSCNNKSVPSIYSNSWQAFSLISRAVGYTFPPNILVFEDLLEDPVIERVRERNQRLIDQIKKDLGDIERHDEAKRRKQEEDDSYFG